MKNLIIGLLCMMASANAVGQSITAAEYYFDTDPGIGTGTALTLTSSDSVTINSSVPVTGLSDGFHTLYVRFKNSDGVWSLSEGRSFIVKSSMPAAGITAAEYFFNTDPGIGNATSLSVTPGDSVQVTMAIPVTGLTAGWHRLYIRVKSTTGVWSLAESRSFMVVAVPGSTNIVAAEYFFNTDPGIGNGLVAAVTNAGDSVQIVMDADVPTLSTGVHNLYVRVKNASGVWSLHDPHEFVVCETYGAVADFEATNDSTTVTFTNASQYADSVYWDFGDGSPVSYELNPQHEYSAFGNYTVCVYASNACGADTLCETILLEPNAVEATNGTKPVLNIFPNPAYDRCSVVIGLTESTDVMLEITDATGKHFISNNLGKRSAGNHQLSLDLTGMSTGVYMCRVVTHQGVSVKRIVIAR